MLYSGGGRAGNERLHLALSLLRGKKARSMTYIPSSHENGYFYFKRIKKRYKSYGIKNVFYFPVDAHFLKSELKRAFKSDVIYLAGGNTFYFLKHLRDSGVLSELQKFVRRGGVLAGLSAGAIMMTPHIYLAGYPEHEGDPNEVRLKNLKSLGLVDFEFLPHYSGSSKTHKALVRYSKKNPERLIVAAPDGSGVVIDGNEYRLMGPLYLYTAGHRLKLS